ncbi:MULTISPECIES: ferredoxin [Leptospira]|uniref:4Fe-4S single cluster domain protein n=15 Tax=Leptospira TaxID=171 RepID=M3FUQ5_9LEPT|nr:MULTISPECIES: ferredoxin [Leptospira]EMF84007.1 4Fe-4S single cluster domain protein [Leptospira weilii serovar Topaz str. LT2116]EMM70478.1 4Fe-4S single cluster domain protein [Leptospira weilii str. 2006001855]EMO08305.1 4Fe-4S single cluster domain protein [Leptospira borgpetersenii str. Noumea 25]EMO64347.1 4Fe-4S single cluster domain protein [Leptospira borgpetersenii serovar Pomona str. 200901868]EMY12710.1 4Fe-4S single cluster domain protein [Leptospira weilii str. Ecochallenge]
MPTKIAYVDKDNCTSCNQCADNLPKYFQMDDNDTSETHIGGEMVNQAPIPEEDWKIVQKEMDECPGECIQWKK